MGNACCSENGGNSDKDQYNYSSKPRNQEAFNQNGTLLAYRSGDKQTIIYNQYRG